MKSTKSATVSPVAPPHRDDIEVHESAGGATLFDPVSSKSLRLNATAMEIWKQCDGSRRAADIAARLTRGGLRVFEVIDQDYSLEDVFLVIGARGAAVPPAAVAVGG